MLSCRRGLPTWEARRLIRNTPRPGGEPWRTAVGAVSLRSTFFSFFFSFFVVVAVWDLAAGTLDPCWCAAWNRPTLVAKCHHLAGLERDATRPLESQHCTAAPQGERALPAKGGGSLQAAQMAPSSTSTRVAGHGIQTCSSCSSRQQQHIASRSPHATGRVRSVPKMGLAHRCHGVQGLSTNAFIYPSSPLPVQSLIDPGIPVSLFSSPGWPSPLQDGSRILKKKKLVCGVNQPLFVSPCPLLSSPPFSDHSEPTVSASLPFKLSTYTWPTSPADLPHLDLHWPSLSASHSLDSDLQLRPASATSFF